MKIALFAVVATAFASTAFAAPETRYCAQVMGVVYHPETGEAVVTSDSCEKNDLIEAGYLTDRPYAFLPTEYCLQVMIPLQNPTTGEMFTAHNSCQAQAMVKNGWIIRR